MKTGKRRAKGEKADAKRRVAVAVGPPPEIYWLADDNLWRQQPARVRRAVKELLEGEDADAGGDVHGKNLARDACGGCPGGSGRCGDGNAGGCVERRCSRPRGDGATCIAKWVEALNWKNENLLDKSAIGRWT